MRYYSNLAKEMTLTASVSAADSVLPLDSVTGLPASFPFTLVIEPGTDAEEIVTCTSLFGTSATVTRGTDGTSAKSHNAASKVRHMLSSRDLAEPQEHIAASTGVHGVGTGSVVGTTSTQTLTNKSMSGASNSFSNIPKSAIPADAVYLATAQTLTNKTLDGASNTFTNIPKSAVAGDTVYTTATQTFSNKTISGSANTLTNIGDSSITGLAASKLTGVVAKANLPSDTMYGSYASSTSFLTFEPGWSIDSASVAQQYGRVYVLEIVVARTGGAFSFNSAGNVTDEKICTISSSTWCPPRTMYPSWVGFDTSGGASVLSTGSVFILDGHPTSDIATGDKVRVNLTFIK